MVAPPAPPRILVVDDEPDLRTLYELTLLRDGYRVVLAGRTRRDFGRRRVGRRLGGRRL